jgi:hypothetical protein
LEIQEIRELFAAASEGYLQAQKFLKALKSIKGQDEKPLFWAYQASGLALEARDTWNPLEKLSLIRKANHRFAEAIKKNPESVEIRFLRFSIESNTPSILGFSEHIGEDIAWIIDNIEQPEVPSDMRPEIARYLLEQNHGKDSDLDKLKSYLPK